MDLNNLKIIKRDGREVSYDNTRIFNAIMKAYRSVSSSKELLEDDKYIDYMETNTQHIVKGVENYLCDEINFSNITSIGVEDVQEFVKLALLDCDKKNVAKEYIEYSTKRKTLRDEEMDLTSRIQRLINGDKEINNENANKDSRTFSTKRDLMAGQVAKAEGLKSLPVKVREAHLRGDIHFHDLDYSPYLPYTNCSLVDLEHMFENGFNMGNAVIGKPKSIQTAVAQTSQIIANVASSQYGGTSINRIDEILEPYANMNYIKYLDDTVKFNIPNPEHYAKEKTTKDIYDSMQSLEYEINTLYTSNGQVGCCKTM